MRKVVIFWILLMGLALAQHLALPAGSLALTSKEGEELLLDSQDRASFWELSARYETQSSQANCGPASGVMVLNALGLGAPASAVHPPYHEYDQANFFTSATDAVLSQATLQKQGATLAELGGMLRAHGLQVQVRHASDSSVENFRTEARRAVGTPGCAVIINYRRKELNQEGGGHFSPLGAYHEGQDMFLVMDPARYKYPPWWTATEALFRSMNTPDTTSGQTRGYLLIERASR